MEKSMEVLSELKIELSYDMPIILLVIYFKELDKEA
jgi:hypothetical protein